ncbi:hypothetical protein B0H34DRAFT_806644 [Crassisporium funariophilum]|nr:hypothetical protein B0H34DRAFT_806644 [Crassisporium funariophilum]
MRARGSHFASASSANGLWPRAQSCHSHFGPQRRAIGAVQFNQRITKLLGVHISQRPMSASDQHKSMTMPEVTATVWGEPEFTRPTSYVVPPPSICVPKNDRKLGSPTPYAHHTECCCYREIPHVMQNVAASSSESNRALTHEYDVLATQFNIVIFTVNCEFLQSPFVATLIIGFLSFANDIIDKPGSWYFQLGMSFAFFAMGFHLLASFVAGRAARYCCQSDLMEAKPVKELYGELAFCKTLQSWGTVMHLLSMFFPFAFMFQTVFLGTPFLFSWLTLISMRRYLSLPTFRDCFGRSKPKRGGTESGPNTDHIATRGNSVRNYQIPVRC